MQTADKSGIHCDYCGATLTVNFVYYSFDLKHMLVVRNLPDIESMLRKDTILSVDICGQCFFNFSQLIAKHNITYSKSTKCDFTGKILSGQYNYYYCVITKVKVNLDVIPNMTFDKRFAEVGVCEDVYNDFLAKLKEIKIKVGKWATSSEG